MRGKMEEVIVTKTLLLLVFTAINIDIGGAKTLTLRPTYFSYNVV